MFYGQASSAQVSLDLGIRVLGMSDSVGEPLDTTKKSSSAKRIKNMGKPYLEFPRPRKHQQHRRKEPLWPDPWLSLVCPQIIVIRRIKMRGKEVSDCILYKAPPRK